MSYTVRLSGSDELGYEADLPGIYQGKPATVLQITKTHIVLKNHGYSMNPGSRNSGLISYYPTMIAVYEIVEAVSERTFRVEQLVEFPALKPQDDVRLPLWLELA